MFTLISIDADYPESNWLVYDRQNNPNALDFLRGAPQPEVTELQFSAKVSLQRLRAYDFLYSDALPLVSRRVSSVLEAEAGSDIQMIPARVCAQDGFSSDYVVPNALRLIDCIDGEASRVVVKSYGKARVARIERFVSKGLCEAGAKIGRIDLRSYQQTVDVPGPIVLHDELAQRLQRMGVKGAHFFDAIP